MAEPHETMLREGRCYQWCGVLSALLLIKREESKTFVLCRPKFPELESLVHHPIDYARVVKAIGNEMDITLIDTLEDILPQVELLDWSVNSSPACCMSAEGMAAINVVTRHHVQTVASASIYTC